jgi:tryptophan aminotransferase
MYFGTSPRIASYFMLEAQIGDRSVGRVLRFDSFSKILSSGIRIGFVTGPTPILDAIDRHVSSCTNRSIIPLLPFPDWLHIHAQTAVANLQSSSFSQAIILTLLRSWGRQGFLTHVQNVAAFYRAKRDVFEAAMRRHLHDIAEWNTPEAGMFFWHVISFF